MGSSPTGRIPCCLLSHQRCRPSFAFRIFDNPVRAGCPSLLRPCFAPQLTRVSRYGLLLDLRAHPRHHPCCRCRRRRSSSYRLISTSISSISSSTSFSEGALLAACQELLPSTLLCHPGRDAQVPPRARQAPAVHRRAQDRGQSAGQEGVADQPRTRARHDARPAVQQARDCAAEGAQGPPGRRKIRHTVRRASSSPNCEEGIRAYPCL